MGRFVKWRNAWLCTCYRGEKCGYKQRNYPHEMWLKLYPVKLEAFVLQYWIVAAIYRYSMHVFIVYSHCEQNDKREHVEPRVRMRILSGKPLVTTESMQGDLGHDFINNVHQKRIVNNVHQKRIVNHNTTHVYAKSFVALCIINV